MVSRGTCSTCPFATNFSKAVVKTLSCGFISTYCAIGLYFTFVGHYTKWLCIPAFIGIAVQAAAFSTDIYGSKTDTLRTSLYLPTFSFIVAMWAIVMLEFWKRKEGNCTPSVTTDT
jgi:Calcium-activated chloride channel